MTISFLQKIISIIIEQKAIITYSYIRVYKKNVLKKQEETKQKEKCAQYRIYLVFGCLVDSR